MKLHVKKNNEGAFKPENINDFSSAFYLFTNALFFVASQCLCKEELAQFDELKASFVSILANLKLTCRTICSQWLDRERRACPSQLYTLSTKRSSATPNCDSR